MLGQQVVFRCADGYSTNDSFVLNCTASGNWSSELPVCTQDQGEPVQCHIYIILLYPTTTDDNRG